MLISKEYVEQNRRLHEERPDYGKGGHRWADTVMGVADKENIRHVLDYGAGKGTLAKSLPVLEVAEYDPAIPGKDAEPSPADMVVCTDVLEHVEPDMLNNVLNHIQSLARRVVILAVATRPAVKNLPDGRNAHLIVEPVEWWLPHLMERFDLLQVNNVAGREFLFVGRTK